MDDATCESSTMKVQNHGRSSIRQTALPGQMDEENSNMPGHGDQ
jgi:hypothetical protein